MLIFRAGIHETLVRIAIREDPDKTFSSEVKVQSDQGLHCLSTVLAGT